eukprot:m.46162 g.46162  ORF g.46162 m.46162 type:complete len:1441 (+) comp11833_c0_seq2:378-4700(+)
MSMYRPGGKRGIDDQLEDAEDTGILSLSGRELRTLPDIADYDLSELTEIDLSHNRLPKVPDAVADMLELEKLNCFHNVIATVPNLRSLQSLASLNLGRNLITTLPAHLCFVPLRSLNLSSNRLSSLPAELRYLSHLRELDCSNNLLEELPDELTEMVELKDLNVSRNRLKALPNGVGATKISVFNFCDNNVMTLPLGMRNMDNLETLLLDNNPLVMPPAHVCARGRVHIFKFLKTEVERMYHERNNPHYDGKGLDLDYEPPKQLNRRHSVLFVPFVDDASGDTEGDAKSGSGSTEQGRANASPRRSSPLRASTGSDSRGNPFADDSSSSADVSDTPRRPSASQESLKERRSSRTQSLRRGAQLVRLQQEQHEVQQAPPSTDLQRSDSEDALEQADLGRDAHDQLDHLNHLLEHLEGKRRQSVSSGQSIKLMEEQSKEIARVKSELERVKRENEMQAQRLREQEEAQKKTESEAKAQEAERQRQIELAAQKLAEQKLAEMVALQSQFAEVQGREAQLKAKLDQLERERQQERAAREIEENLRREEELKRLAAEAERTRELQRRQELERAAMQQEVAELAELERLRAMQRNMAEQATDRQQLEAQVERERKAREEAEELLRKERTTAEQVSQRAEREARLRQEQEAEKARLAAEFESERLRREQLEQELERSSAVSANTAAAPDSGRGSRHGDEAPAATVAVAASAATSTVCDPPAAPESSVGGGDADDIDALIIPPPVLDAQGDADAAPGDVQHVPGAGMSEAATHQAEADAELDEIALPPPLEFTDTEQAEDNTPADTQQVADAPAGFVDAPAGFEDAPVAEENVEQVLSEAPAAAKDNDSDAAPSAEEPEAVAAEPPATDASPDEPVGVEAAAPAPTPAPSSAPLTTSIPVPASPGSRRGSESKPQLPHKPARLSFSNGTGKPLTSSASVRLSRSTEKHAAARPRVATVSSTRPALPIPKSKRSSSESPRADRKGEPAAAAPAAPATQQTTAAASAAATAAGADASAAAKPAVSTRKPSLSKAALAPRRPPRLSASSTATPHIAAAASRSAAAKGKAATVETPPPTVHAPAPSPAPAPTTSKPTSSAVGRAAAVEPPPEESEVVMFSIPTSKTRGADAMDHLAEAERKRHEAAQALEDKKEVMLAKLRAREEAKSNGQPTPTPSGSTIAASTPTRSASSRRSAAASAATSSSTSSASNAGTSAASFSSSVSRSSAGSVRPSPSVAEHQPLSEAELKRVQQERRAVFDAQLNTDKQAYAASDDARRNTACRLVNALQSFSSDQYKTTSLCCAGGAYDFLEKAGINEAGDRTIGRLVRTLFEEVQVLQAAVELIEETIKEPIPDLVSPHDLASCISDGIVLCKCLNVVQPNSIKTIYANVEKCSLKARKNVDGFLEGCRRIGVQSAHGCSALSILQEKDTDSVIEVLTELLTDERLDVAAV